MSEAMPSFMLSPYFYYDENGNGALRDGAPEEIVTEFDEWYSGESDLEWMEGPSKLTLTEDDLKDL